MTRNRLSRFVSPPRRRRGLAALVAAAVVTNSFGFTFDTAAFAQTTNGVEVSTAGASSDTSPQIKQVVGKQLTGGRRTSSGRSGGLLGGLFGGTSSSQSSSSSKADEPYRKATPVPSDREVDWQGIPYHGSRSSRTASRAPAPIQDPSSRSQSTRTQSTRPQATTTPSSRVAESRRSSLPKPAPITSVPRKLKSTAKPEAVGDVSSRRPAPLSVSSSSRRPVPKTSDSYAPVKLEPKAPSLVARDSKPIELVPKVSRKVLQVPASTTQSEKTANSSTAVASKDSGSSRRSQPALVAKPSSAEPLVSKPAATPSMTVQPRKSETNVEASKVAAKPAAPKETSPQAKSPEVVAVAKAAVAKPAPQQTAPPQSSPERMTTMTLGAARQATLGTAIAANNAPAPNAVQAQPQAVMSLPADSGFATASSRSQAPASGRAVQPNAAPHGHMTTYGADSTSARSGGTLRQDGQATGISLQPLSDRLPAGETVAKTDAPPISPDGFGARSTNVQGMPSYNASAPNYPAAGHGQATSATPAVQPTYQRSAPVNDATPMVNNVPANVNLPANVHPNAMRQSIPAQHPAVPHAVAAMHPAVQPNTNTTATELPGIRVMTAGPRNIMIRQTHPYEVIVENRGSVAAEGLLVRAHIPDWADVVGQQVTRGDVQGNTDESIRNLHWKLDRLSPGQSEKMFVRLKASRPGTHDLDVDWTMQPQSRKMQVTVQEPELALTIDGPDEVIYGHSKTYQIRVLNPGDGIAPDVVFTLSPKSSSPQSQRIGDIPAGKEAQFEIELTAQDLGELKIHGLAVGDLELRAEADKTVRVLAADLEAVLSGPELKYQDAESLYQLQLTNRGTTASENVIANLELPIGVSYQGGLEGATVTGNQLRWKIASLTPGAVRQYQFQCRMEATGKQTFKFECKGSAAGQTNVALDTNVEAIADLVLSIEDPQAPAPIGKDVVYQIVIRNRGSKPANDVQAVAQFSHGIEPSQLTGHQGKVITGQVLIEPIARIDAGEEVRMKIVARADTSGHHRFRTEVRSGDTVLVAEEATHYLEASNERITRRSGTGGNEISPPLR